MVEPRNIPIDDFADFSLDRQSCFSELGYGDTHPEFIDTLFDETVSQCQKLSQAKTGWIVIEEKDFSLAAPYLTCAGVVFQVGGIIAKHAKGSIAGALVLGTAGPGIEEWSRKLMSDGDPVKGFIADWIGSQLADQSGKIAIEYIKRTIRQKGWKTTPLFSPGTCGWDVSGQQELFKLFQKDFLGISLTESSLMQPIKSVSGFVGMGPDVDDSMDLCSVCGFEKCHNRIKTAGKK
jgi:hypothetical protein